MRMVFFYTIMLIVNMKYTKIVACNCRILSTIENFIHTKKMSEIKSQNRRHIIQFYGLNRLKY